MEASAHCSPLALRFARDFGSQEVFQLKSNKHTSERRQLGEEQRGRTLFGDGASYAELSNMFNRGAKIKKTDITEKYGLDAIDGLYGKNYIPMFVITGKKIRVMSAGSNPPELGSTFVYLATDAEENKTARA